MKDTQKNHKTYKIIMLLVLTIFMTFLLTSLGMFQYFAKDSISNILASDKESQKLAKKLSDYKLLIEENFLGEIDEEKLNEGAIKGYIEALDDPYTEYISKSELEDVMESTLGKYMGIGIYMTEDKEKDKILIVALMKDKPAEKAGLLPGDYILSVNDVEYTGKQTDQLSDAIRNNANSTIKINVLRGEETKTFEVKTEEIKLNPIENKVIKDNIGYIEIGSFDEGTSDEVKTKYEELQEKGIRSLIIDLRNNGGGIVEEALKIADYVLEKDKVILYEVDKKGNETVKKSEEDPTINIPIVILTNENTASASEILAAALKENNKAKIVGTKTYGKGVIQKLIQFTDGSGIKITSAEYLTPNKTKINKVGIEPDEEVELPNDEKNKLGIEESKDTQLQKAIELAGEIGE